MAIISLLQNRARTTEEANLSAIAAARQLGGDVHALVLGQGGGRGRRGHATPTRYIGRDTALGPTGTALRESRCRRCELIGCVSRLGRRDGRRERFHAACGNPPECLDGFRHPRGR